MTRLKIIKTVHYGRYVQSAENLICEMAGHERYRFQVREDGRQYKPWIVTPTTDLTDVPMNILEPVANGRRALHAGDHHSTRQHRHDLSSGDKPRCGHGRRNVGRESCRSTTGRHGG